MSYEPDTPRPHFGSPDEKRRPIKERKLIAELSAGGNPGPSGSHTRSGDPELHGSHDRSGDPAPPDDPALIRGDVHPCTRNVGPITGEDPYTRLVSILRAGRPREEEIPDVEDSYARFLAKARGDKNLPPNPASPDQLRKKRRSDHG